MAKQIVGQLVYTVEADARPFVAAMQRTEQAAQRAANRATPFFNSIEKNSFKAQRSLLAMAGAADLLGSKISSFVFAGVRAVDVLTTIGNAAATSATKIRDATKAQAGLVAQSRRTSDAVSRGLGVAIRNQVLEAEAKRFDLTRDSSGRFGTPVLRGPSGRFESVSQQVNRFAAAPIVSMQDLQALAIGPKLAEATTHATRLQKAMTAMGAAASLAGRGVMALVAGFKALLFTPVSAAILAIVGVLEIYSHFQNKAKEADEKRKKAIDDLIESNKKHLDILKKLRDESTQTARDEPNQSRVRVLAARAAASGNPIAQIKADAARRRLDLQTEIESRRAELAREQAKSGVYRDEIQALSRLTATPPEMPAEVAAYRMGKAQSTSAKASLAFQEEEERFRGRMSRLAENRRGLAASEAAAERASQALSNLSMVMDELGKEERRKIWDEITNQVHAARKAANEFWQSVKDGFMKAREKQKREREQRFIIGQASTVDLLFIGKERAQLARDQLDQEKRFADLARGGAFGALTDEQLARLGVEPDKPAVRPPHSGWRSGVTELSAFGGRTLGNFLLGGRDTEEEQTSLLQRIAALLARIERKPAFGLGP